MLRGRSEGIDGCPWVESGTEDASSQAGSFSGFLTGHSKKEPESKASTR